MKRMPCRLPSKSNSQLFSVYQSAHTTPFSRCLHKSSLRSATPLPLTATGPPPAPPESPSSQHSEKLDRRRRQADLMRSAHDIRNSKTPPITGSASGTAMKKRFWKSVSVTQEPEGQSAHIIHLDARPVRNPLTNPAQPLQIPASKPHLATAIALEWDHLTSAAQALRAHLIPLTSLAARAQVLEHEDAQSAQAGYARGAGEGQGIRYEIMNTLLRYLDTDTLLCWAPEQSSAATEEGSGLREKQVETAKPILSFLTQVVWPGVELVPALSDGSILPKSQPAATRAVVKGWMAGLPAWELVGLERAALAGKSLSVAARLVAEWSEELRLSNSEERLTFGVEDAAKACSVEVDWQTGRWGEVEDSHDVDKEDLRRQLGAVILLVSGKKC